MKKITTNTDTLCPVCGEGQLRPQRIDYTVKLKDGSEVTVPDLPVDQCDHCGEVALSPEAADKVDATIAEQTEQLTPRELERIREDCGVDQTAMSEILGLGGKTYHRWEKGNQVPSRSMGYYLRLLAEYPETFAWLRNRGWRTKNRVSGPTPIIDLHTAFPDLRGATRTLIRFEESRFNPARALFGPVRR